MPIVKCPIESCEYETPDVDPVVAAALITTHATFHQGPSLPTLSARVEKVKRPSISSAGTTTEDWLCFKSRWADYVKATRLEGTDRVIQLLECCEEQLRKDLTRNAGGTLTTLTEDQVFAAMKSLAIREENTMVSRVTLQNMRQGRDEPVRAFGARIRGQASICKFIQKCSGCEANVDYTEAMVKDVLCRGLEDSDIQMDLLGNKNKDMTLEQVLRFFKAKESGKRSASRLLVPQSTDAVAGGSSYRKLKRASSKDQGTCTYCGTRGHRRHQPTRVRRKECPAYGTTCSSCNKDHHFESVCKNKGDTKLAKRVEHEDATFDVLCQITSANKTGGASMDHHIFDKVTKRWLKRHSKVQPHIMLRANVLQEDYDHFGIPMKATLVQSTLSVIADTGCQSCLAGLKVINKLGISMKDLIPVSE